MRICKFGVVLLILIIVLSMMVAAQDVDKEMADDAVVTIRDEAFKNIIYSAIVDLYYEENDLWSKAYYSYKDDVEAYKESLKKNGITFGDMKKIKKLSFAAGTYYNEKGEIRELDSIEGIEYAINLERIYIDMMQRCPELLTPLKNCTNLKYIELSGGNNKVNMSFLNSLSDLKELTLGFLGKDDLKECANLRSLEKLELKENLLTADVFHILDIEPLRRLINLKELLLANNPVTNISPLENLHGLSRLTIGCYELEDITPIKGLTQLKYLSLSGNIKSIGSLSGLINLEGLSVSTRYKSIDISAVKNMTKLKSLEFYNFNISDISPLRGLSELSVLTLDNNNINNISPLSNLRNLKELNLTTNQISDISPLGNLINLEHLSIAQNKITDITAMKYMKSLKEVYLFTNRVEDASPLKYLGNLSYIQLFGSPLNKTSKADLKYLHNKINYFAIDEDIDIFEDIISEEAPVTSLSEGIIKRLQSYAYYFKEPQVGFSMMNVAESSSGENVINDFFEQGVAGFGKNEKFITSPDLVYITWNDSYAIRGILQTTLNDGTIQEQEVEFIIAYHAPGKQSFKKLLLRGDRIIKRI